MRIALIAGSKTKCRCKGAHRAKELYTSLLFNLSYWWARRRRLDRIFILSAKYGLLDPEKYIEPYNRSLTQMAPSARRKWAVRVARDIRLMVPGSAEIVFLAGEDYRRDLIPILRQSYTHMALMRGLGLGRKIQWLKRELSTEVINLGIMVKIG